MNKRYSDIHNLWVFCQDTFFESSDNISKIVNDLKYGDEVRPDHKKNMLIYLKNMYDELRDFESFVKKL